MSIHIGKVGLARRSGDTHMVHVASSAAESIRNVTNRICRREMAE
ncbi:hypothetical protein HNP72_001278 [Sphingobacterium soli]|nr:hypothetical protein [Sphingobacterium soli]